MGSSPSCGWRATYKISELLNLVAEGYGAIEGLGNAAPVSEQEHRIGPVVYLGHVHGNPEGTHGHAHKEHEHAGQPDGYPEWHGEIGVLFGLTDATPDAAIKLNIGADF